MREQKHLNVKKERRRRKGRRGSGKRRKQKSVEEGKDVSGHRNCLVNWETKAREGGGMWRKEEKKQRGGNK